MPAVATPWAVRRLTPTECERLQGFPDDFTKIPTAASLPTSAGRPALQGARELDGRQRMEWIGERIQMVENL